MREQVSQPYNTTGNLIVQHQLFVYADDVNMLGEHVLTVMEITKIFMKASKDIGFEFSENTKYTV